MVTLRARHAQNCLVAGRLQDHDSHQMHCQELPLQCLCRLVQILPMGASKGAGVARMLKNIGASADGLMALGDGENDVQMFEVGPAPTPHTPPFCSSYKPCNEEHICSLDARYAREAATMESCRTSPDVDASSHGPCSLMKSCMTRYMPIKPCGPCLATLDVLVFPV